MYKPIKHYLATGGLCVFTHFLPRRGKNKRSEKGREISALTHSTGQTEAGRAPVAEPDGVGSRSGADRRQEDSPRTRQQAINPISGQVSQHLQSVCSVGEVTRQDFKYRVFSLRNSPRPPGNSGDLPSPEMLIAFTDFFIL